MAIVSPFTALIYSSRHFRIGRQMKHRTFTENKCDLPLLWARVPSGLARALRCSVSHSYARHRWHRVSDTQSQTDSSRAAHGLHSSDEMEVSGTQEQFHYLDPLLLQNNLGWKETFCLSAHRDTLGFIKSAMSHS